MFLLLIAIQPTVAQTSKIYITKSGNVTNEPFSASAYMLIQKVNDTLYRATEYDLRDTILLSGEYKDASLSTPNGKFNYYRKPKLTSKFIHSPADTTNYIQLTGNYINGTKEGLWISYNTAGEKQSEKTYKNDKLNGSVITYTPVSGEWTSEEMINGISTGSTHSYNEDSVLMWETHLENGRPSKVITHITGGEPKYDFESYLEGKLKAYKKLLMNASPLLKFTITKEGKLTKLILKQGISPEIDNAIIEAVGEAPPFEPAKLDGNAIDFKTNRLLFLFQKKIHFKDQRDMVSSSIKF